MIYPSENTEILDVIQGLKINFPICHCAYNPDTILRPMRLYLGCVYMRSPDRLPRHLQTFSDCRKLSEFVGKCRKMSENVAVACGGPYMRGNGVYGYIYGTNLPEWGGGNGYSSKRKKCQVNFEFKIRSFWKIKFLCYTRKSNVSGLR